MSDATIKAHKAASAERRKSTVNAAQLLKFRDTISSGVKSATDTGMYILIPKTRTIIFPEALSEWQNW